MDTDKIYHGMDPNFDSPEHIHDDDKQKPPTMDN